MKNDSNALEIKFNKTAANMLVEFVNTKPESASINRFVRHWNSAFDLSGGFGGDAGFRSTQAILQNIWESKQEGLEGFQAELSLGLQVQAGEESEGPVPIRVNWNEGRLYLLPRNLHDLVWLTLVQQSQRLRVCANKVGCQTPFFLKYKPKQKFCSAFCAKPAQRRFKRKWWAEHGEAWRSKRKESKPKRKGGRNEPRKTR